MEWRHVGSQVFKGFGDNEWEEIVDPSPGSRTPLVHSKRFISLLNEPEIELLATNEIVASGNHVYRLRFTGNYTNQSKQNHEITTVSTTILIDQESFRIITVFRDKTSNYYDDLTADEITPDTRFRWVQSISVDYFYDFNEPIAIEIPENYIPWNELVALK